MAASEPETPTIARGYSSSDRTANALLEATIDALDTVGEGGLRISVLLEQADSSVSSLYHHFGSREGLVIAANSERFTRSIALQIETFAAAMEQVTSSEELEAVLAGVIASLNDPESQIFRQRRISVLGGALTRPALLEAISERQHELFALTATVIDTAKDRGLVRADLDSLAYASWLFGMILGRMLAEIDPSRPDQSGWDEIALQALVAPLRLSG